MSAKRIIGALLLVAVGAGIGVGVALTVSGDDEDEPRTTDLPVETTTTVDRPDEDLNPEAAELYDLVTAFADLTVHARYQVEVADRAGAASVIEIWQKDGQVRQEATVASPQGEGRIAMLDLEDRVILCQQPPDGEYSCGLVSEQQATAFEDLRTNLIRDLAGQEVEVQADEINGRAVRCFAIAVAAESEICATDEGLLVRITSPEGSFELLEAEMEVDDEVFTPPATPSATAPTTPDA